MPKVPSLSKALDRRIDPIVEDSTWALGSQKWIPNNGTFTRKVSMAKNLANDRLIGQSYLISKQGPWEITHRNGREKECKIWGRS